MITIEVVVPDAQVFELNAGQYSGVEVTHSSPEEITVVDADA